MDASHTVSSTLQIKWEDKSMTINRGRMVWTPVMLYRPRMRSQIGYRETDKLCNEVEKLQPILDWWQMTKKLRGQR